VPEVEIGLAGSEKALIIRGLASKTVRDHGLFALFYAAD